MNGFRITLLVMLGLAVGALLCIVTFFQNNQQANYDAYQTKVQANERQLQIDEHKARMERIGPRAEGLGTEEIDAAVAERHRRINEAEERNVLATAQRRDAERVAEQAQQVADEEKPLGLVASFDKEWGFLMVKPVSESPLPKGMVVAIRRAGNILCEAEIGDKDEESGQYSAAIRETDFNSGKGSIAAEKFEPTTGDEVIMTPFASTRDLRTGGSSIMSVIPSGDSAPLPALPYDGPVEDAIPEVDATLTPMP